jgi:Flp pilus assembly protein TadG
MLRIVRAGARGVRRGDRGAGLVEFALILPLLMALILGLFTGGVAYNRKISITNAVREGARYGATLSCSASCVSAGSWETQVKARVAASSGGELTAADVCAWLGSAVGTVACGQSDPPGAAGTLVAKVSASKAAALDVMFFKQTITLSSKATARYERTTGYNE